MNITIPDHFLYIDRAAVISAWIWPIGILTLIFLVFLLLILIGKNSK